MIRNRNDSLGHLVLLEFKGDVVLKEVSVEEQEIRDKFCSWRQGVATAGNFLRERVFGDAIIVRV